MGAGWETDASEHVVKTDQGDCKWPTGCSPGRKPNWTWLWGHSEEEAAELPYPEGVGLEGRCFREKEQCVSETWLSLIPSQHS